MQLCELDPRTKHHLHTGDAAATLSTGFVSDSQPDEHWSVMVDTECRGRCALWWRQTPTLKNRRVGLIGNYYATDQRAAEMLMTHACKQLRRHGCSIAVGPMDGNTWGNYRFVTDRGSRPWFWMEPRNPPEWPLHFLQHGFRPLADYFSALNSDLGRRDCRLDRVAQRLEAADVRLRTLREATLEDDLRGIYAVATTAFRRNLLYSELGEDVFLAQAKHLLRLVPSDLCCLAEDADRVVGFIFAIPDLEELARKGRSRTLIVKTLAVLPDRSYAGLGNLLLAEVQQRANDFGYTQAIHALVRDVGSLRNMSARYAEPMRRYTLFAKVLAP